MQNLARFVSSINCHTSVVIVEVNYSNISITNGQ
jgi:hypothetical protein